MSTSNQYSNTLALVVILLGLTIGYAFFHFRELLREPIVCHGSPYAFECWDFRFIADIKYAILIALVFTLIAFVISMNAVKRKVRYSRLTLAAVSTLLIAGVATFFSFLIL